MALTALTTSLQATISARLRAVNSFGNSLNVDSPILFGTTDGTGADKADQLYVAGITLAASANTSLNVYSFGGQKDPNGQALTIVKVKLIMFQILGKTSTTPPTFTDADYLTIGGDGTTASWTSFLPSSSTNLPPLYSGSATNPGTIIFASGSGGWSVGASSTNNVLKFTNGSGSNALSFNIVIIGATA